MNIRGTLAMLGFACALSVCVTALLMALFSAEAPILHAMGWPGL